MIILGLQEIILLIYCSSNFFFFITEFVSLVMESKDYCTRVTQPLIGTPGQCRPRPCPTVTLMLLVTDSLANVPRLALVCVLVNSIKNISGFLFVCLPTQGFQPGHIPPVPVQYDASVSPSSLSQQFSTSLLAVSVGKSSI